MDDRPRPSPNRPIPDPGGLTLVDGAALVSGAAVASVHIRGSIPQGLPGTGWVLVWAAFAGMALTAAGPFVYLGRRFGRRTAGYPLVGDRLWTLWGLPWVLTALLRTASSGTGPRRDDLVTIGLTLGLGLATLVSLVVVWKTWVLVPPGELSSRPPTPWTNRVGLILSVAWPIQYGLGLVVLEGST